MEMKSFGLILAASYHAVAKKMAANSSKGMEDMEMPALPSIYEESLEMPM
jgi:hypothetical protein